MQYHLKKNEGDNLPFIHPIVLYHGKRPWKYSTDLFAMYSDDVRQLAKESFLDPFDLIDVHRMSKEELEKKGMAEFFAWALKNVDNRDTLSMIEKVRYLVVEVNREKDDTVNYFLAYFKGDKERIKNWVKKLADDKLRGAVMTVTEQWFHEGKDEGRDEAKHDIARKMIQRNLDRATIAEICGLTLLEIKNIKQGSKASNEAVVD